MRLHYLAIDQKNKFFLLLTTQRLTVFNPKKNPRFLHQTRRFVQRVGGLCFLKETKMNTKSHDTVNILTLFVRSFGSQQGVSLRPSEVVQMVRQAMDDWLTTPPGSKRTTKTVKT